MKVNNILSLIGKIDKILELYKNYSISEALDNILIDLKEYKKYKDKEKVFHKQSNSSIDFEKVISELKNKDRETIINILEELTKNDLLNITSHIGLKMKSDATKVQIVNEIINHFSFMQLNNKISERKSNSSEPQN
ncbi:hypothetical protein PVA17_24800 [Lysinibacillus sp. CNPSo 3705]|uniref:hypothetical protein n=1 Tax=Lysinibacillus sp. CNPSo 3705 TaxID=3028148 RepID=UPI002364788B|nr:hypothetical protein [Lysinibacillus sp. CNPSo 3705]MDD1505935.1 hypothetical protein [Lysinibacillus sp. CNPSo 3705]